MKQSESVLYILDQLDLAEIPYMVGGSVACMNYSIPRATKDFDLVIKIHEPEFTLFLSAIDAHFELDPQVYLESLTGTRRFILSHRTSAFDVELFILSEDPHHLEMWHRRFESILSFCQRRSWTPTAEDMIIQKLRWSRPQDIIDVEQMIEIQFPNLDWLYIERWCDIHGTRHVLEEIKANITSLD